MQTINVKKHLFRFKPVQSIRLAGPGLLVLTIILPGCGQLDAGKKKGFSRKVLESRTWGPFPEKLGLFLTFKKSRYTFDMQAEGGTRCSAEYRLKKNKLILEPFKGKPDFEGQVIYCTKQVCRLDYNKKSHTSARRITCGNETFWSLDKKDLTPPGSLVMVDQRELVVVNRDGNTTSGNVFMRLGPGTAFEKNECSGFPAELFPDKNKMPAQNTLFVTHRTPKKEKIGSKNDYWYRVYFEGFDIGFCKKSYFWVYGAFLKLK